MRDDIKIQLKKRGRIKANKEDFRTAYQKQRLKVDNDIKDLKEKLEKEKNERNIHSIQTEAAVQSIELNKWTPSYAIKKTWEGMTYLRRSIYHY